MEEKVTVSLVITFLFVCLFVYYTTFLFHFFMVYDCKHVTALT